MNQNSYGGDLNQRSQYFEARQHLSQTELASPQNRYRTINHPEIDTQNDFYGDQSHQNANGYCSTDVEPVHQVQYYESSQNLNQPYQLRASSHDEARRAARHQKYKRDPAAKKGRQSSSQNHNRSVKNSNLTKNLVNQSIIHEKKSIKTDLNTSLKVKRAKRTNSKRNSRMSSGSKGQEGRNSRQSRAKKENQKSRTISPDPAEFNAYRGSTNLRQPLTFIQQANSGSLGPPENRYNSQG